jgi:hypothetical protein
VLDLVSEESADGLEMVIPAPPLLNYSNKISKGLFDGSTGFKIDGGLKGE